MFTFFAFVAIAIMAVQLADTRSRLKRAEETLLEAAKRIGVLQRHAGLLPPKPGEAINPATWRTAETPTAPIAPEPRAASAAPEPLPEAETLPEPRPKQEPAPVAIAAAAPAVALVSEPAAPEQEIEPAGSLATRFEVLFGKQLPIWAGGITLAIAGVLIVKYAIDAGFFARIFTHGVQVAAGLLFGSGLIAGAEFAWRNEDRVRDPRVPQALSGAGLATLYASVLVAASVYHLVGPAAGFVGLAAITAAALALALRFGAPSAVLGLVGGLAGPALLGSSDPNVPVLAIDLALTVGGLVGVSRMRRWPWLALAALAGGASWSLLLVLGAGTLDTLSALSTGALVLVLALALPALAIEGPRRALLRSASAAIGALQLAILVAIGGFVPLHWGLFVLIAAAGQVLAWRERDYAIVPTISLGLSLLLLALWPAPAASWFAAIALALSAIHAGPLLARLWPGEGNRGPAVQLSALAWAAPTLVWLHFPALADAALAGVAAGGALLLAVALGLGWRSEARLADLRFAGLTAAMGLLLALAGLLLTPHWAAPLVLAALGLGLLQFGQIARDRWIEPVAAAMTATSLPALLLTAPIADELPRLVLGAAAIGTSTSLLRWGVLALLVLVFAVRSRMAILRHSAQVVTALLAYGLAAQILPEPMLILFPALAGGALLMTLPKVPPPRLLSAIATFAALSLAWAAEPLAIWVVKGLASIAGMPMTIDDPLHGLGSVLRRLLLPALALGGALWLQRTRVAPWTLRAGLIAAATICAVATHILYRLGFAALLGADFTATGLAQRTVWEALLLAAGWGLMQRERLTTARPVLLAGALHALVYTVGIHNPLWAAQNVGSWPLLNLLAPAFAVVPLGLALFTRAWPERPAVFDRICQFAQMAAVSLLAWATLRQAFHGGLLIDPGVLPAENILRSLLLLGLAIGFLLWGIRRAERDWRIVSLVLMLGAVGKVFLFDASGLEGLLRIGSFVALGFSLIGIGWLYSRQLAKRPAQSGEAG